MRLAGIGYIGLALLSGCASHRSVSIACFVDDAALKSKQPKEIPLPLIINEGTVLYYDENEQLNRLNKAVCGVK